MSKRRFHVVPQSDGWALKEEGSDSAVATFDTQKEAIEDGRERATNDEDEVDLIVHRQNGRIRNRISFNGKEDSVDVDKSKSKEINPENIISVGSRVSWAAMTAGIVMALSTYVILGYLGWAMRLSVGEQMSQQALAYASLIWSAASFMVALFLGGFTISQTTAGETKCEASIYGVLLWGSLFILMPLLGTLFGADGIGMMWNRMFVINAEVAGLTSSDHIVFSWITFSSMVIALGVAIAGTLSGAGPRVMIRRTAQTKLTTK